MPRSIITHFIAIWDVYAFVVVLMELSCPATAGVKVLLARHALFSFFISIIPALNAGRGAEGIAS